MGRELHGIRWKDDLSWMEGMKGPKWDAFVRQQTKRKKALTSKSQQPIALLEKELQAASLLGKSQLFRAASNSIAIGYQTRFSIVWYWLDQTEHRTALDLDFCSKYKDYVWVIEETESSKGAEVYQVCCYQKGKDQCVWKHKGVGPYCTIVGGRCYVLEETNKLWYHKLISFDALTGTEKRVDYEETDPRYNLELLHGSCTTAVLRRQAGPMQDCFWIESKGVRLVDSVSLESRRFLFDSTNPLNYYTWSLDAGWKAHGKVPKVSVKQVPEYVCVERDLLVTRWKGQRTIWRHGKAVFHDLANLLADPWESGWVRITMPGRDVIWWDSAKEECPRVPIVEGRRVQLRESAKGVPYGIVFPPSPVTHLFVCGYGAYGMTSVLGTQRWEPLLQRGWAICLPMWRGGGDHTPEWEDAGRRDGREQVLEDAVELIREVQLITAVPPSRTWIFGRSAGGLWAGGIVARHPYGDLIAGAFMEVPYVDVLATTTNRELPLTNMEADEFGLPAARLSDFAGILKWSPMEQLVSLKKPPTIWQIVRTGMNDSQVYAYEAAKWVARSGSHAFLGIEDGQGHFVSGALGARQEAEDLATILDLAKIKNRRRVYTMADRKNRKETRKNRKDRKDRKDRKNRKGTRKNRKATMRKNRK